MPSYYITFGQNHRHEINGKALDKDTVLRMVEPDYWQARRKAFVMFGSKWAFIYQDFKDVQIDLYPKGLIEL